MSSKKSRKKFTENAYPFATVGCDGQGVHASSSAENAEVASPARAGDRSMATVKIDLGFGEQAVLSERAGFGISTAKHRRDAEEFLRRWPQTRSIQQERGYLQQLGLHLGYSLSGVNPSDASALLRAAVKSGTVTVVIERAAPPSGGGISGPGPTRPPYPLSERVKTARVAPARKSYSYDRLSNYDDVSANDLIAYLEDFLSRTSGVAASPAVDSSTLLADARPFEYSEDSTIGDVDQLAGMPFNGTPNSWASSMPGTMPQLRQYGPSGTPMTDIDFEVHHGNPNPHAHNWEGTSRDEGAPVSILPW